MSTTYDWSPVFSGLQGLGQQMMWKKALEQFGGQQAQPQPPGPAPYQIQSNPIAPVQSPFGPVGGIPSAQMPAPPQAPPQAPGALGGNMAKIMPFLQMMGPQAGMPLLLQALMKQGEYDTTPRIGTNPNTGQLDQYLVNKDGTGVRWLNVKPREKMEVSDHTAYNPYEVHSGDQIGTPKTENPLVNNESGQMSFDHGKSWQPIPNFMARAGQLADTKRADKPPNPNAPIQLVHPSSGY